MKITQTLWTGQKDLLKDGFGWIDSEHHLTAWALSCIKLREFYDDVVLYTDSQGKKILGDCLHLPYTEIKVVYDKLKCRQAHWAYPKIMTYSLQDGPFLHVDGDVILTHPISEDIMEAGLIAQNKEIISDYYTGMVNDIVKRGTVFPSYLKKDIDEKTFGSYNAGVIGGSDIDFIKRYCNEADKIIRDNGMNDPASPNMAVNNNILFEQMLFYSLVKHENKDVRTVVNHDVQDNGYSYHEFADFYQQDKHPLIHMLGGHKRNRKVCELMRRMLFKLSPKTAGNISMLFRDNHVRLVSDTGKEPDLSIQMCVGMYLDHLKDTTAKWNDIPHDRLFENERQSSSYLDFIIGENHNREEYVFKRNPYTDIFLIPEDWQEEAKILVRDRIDRKKSMKPLNVALIPLLYGNKGYSEVLINDVQYNILLLSEKETGYDDLFEGIKSCLSDDVVIDDRQLHDLIKVESEYLAYNKLLFIYQSHQKCPVR